MQTWTDFAAIAVDVVGFLLAIGLAAAAIYLIRAPLREFLERLLGDARLARSGVTLVLILLGLRGLTTAFGFIRQTNLNQLFVRLFAMLNTMGDEVQWVVWIGALLFIGLSIRTAFPRDGQAEQSEPDSILR